MEVRSKRAPLARALRGGGLAAWSVAHPIGVVMIALAVLVLGGFAVFRLNVNLLPHIIYPDIRVRILDPGVPAPVMEDAVTRQLEEQLAITEDAIGVQSRTSEGRSAVDLSFEYGKDIDIALRDASSRLDRAKRFLPDTIEPPIIYKRDPSQIPVLELVVSSRLRDPVELRGWVDYTLSRWLVNLPGVAAAEVGGGLVREVQVLPDQERLAGLGLSLDDLATALRQGNLEQPGGRVLMRQGELSGRTAGRFTTVEAIARLPVPFPEGAGAGGTLHLSEVAQVIDGHQEERLRIRANGVPGIKLSVQKQPQANTVSVVDSVSRQLSWLRDHHQLPEDVEVRGVDDQSVYVRHALDNAVRAATSGALLAMAVVYLFLGNLTRTLIIGSVIPLAILVTFVLMDLAELTLNIMTLGGLALGVGILVDSTIVMLENIYRHQRAGEDVHEAPVAAAREVNSAIVAATSTNLAAVLPFLLVGGLVGLLFRELIFTLSAAILASLVVALTLVPALGGLVRAPAADAPLPWAERLMDGLREAYGRLVAWTLRRPWLAPVVFLSALVLAVPSFLDAPRIFLPKMDEGRVSVSITADPGINLDEMDARVQVIEAVLLAQPEVETVYSQVGGFVFGRSQFEASNRSSLTVQLVPASRRSLSSDAWIRKMRGLIEARELAGVAVRMRSRGVRGVRLSQGDDDISIRVQGPDLGTLGEIGDALVARLEGVPGLRNLKHSLEEVRQEVSVRVDRERAADLGLNVRDVGRALRIALEGEVVTDFIEGDRGYDVRLRLPRQVVDTLAKVQRVILFAGNEDRPPVYLGDLARVELTPSPVTIQRDRQHRVVEVSASLTEGASAGRTHAALWARLDGVDLPEGYTLYDGGSADTLVQGQRLGWLLLSLAIFLVLVVMAVQYESLRGPLVILFSVPYAAIGVAIALRTLHLPLSMPVWLGLIMLAGIVVNNAIVLVEYIELERQRGHTVAEAILRAARLRLRPIIMTTLTTVVGMAPLALGLGEGAEMLRPLAITIVYGLSFSALVSLVLVPSVYRLSAR